MKYSQTSLSFLATVSILGLGLVNSILLARWLGPEGRGEVAAALLWPLIIPYLGATGMVDALLVFAARPDADIRRILGSSFVFGVALSAPLVPLSYVILPYLIASQRSEVVQASQLLLLAIPVIILVEFLVQLLRARMLMGLYNVQRLVVPGGYLLGTIILHAMDKLSVMNIVLLQMGLVLLRLLVALLLCRFARIKLGLGFDRGLLNQMLTFGGKSHVGAVAEHGNSQLDQALIAAWLPPAQLGLYVAAASATSIIKSLSTALKITILPQIARESDVARQNSVLSRGFQVYWTLTWLVSPAFALSLYWIIPFVFGADFSGAVGPAIVLILGANIFGAKDLLTTGSKAMGLPWLGSSAELVALLVTLILLAILLPVIGILGAAITSVVAYAIALWIVMWGIRRERLITFRQLMMPNKGKLGSVRGVLRGQRISI